MDTLHKKISHFISQLLIKKKLPDVSETETQLVTNGYLDSIDVMQLVVHLEREFQLNFSARGFDQTDFDSVESIVSLIKELGP